MNIIKGTIDRFEGDKAVIKTEFGDQILWPKNKLSSDLTEGAVINLAIMLDSQATDSKEELAKQILNQILKNSH